MSSIYLYHWSELDNLRHKKINSLIKKEIVTSDFIGFISLYVTGKCHLKCSHCHAEEDFGLEEDVPLEDLITILTKLRGLTNRIQLTGGEIMMRRDSISKKNDILLLVDVANQLNFDIILSTTGMQIKNSMLPILKERNVSWFSLSLDGHDPKTNSLIRNNDLSWEKTIELIPKLKKEGFNVKVGTVITQINSNLINLRKIGNILHSLNVDVWKLTQFFPREVGRASSKNENKLKISNETFNSISEKIHDEFYDKFKTLTFQPISDFSSAPAFLVSPLGNISVTINTSDKYLGNILIDKIDKIKNNIININAQKTMKKNELGTYTI